MEQVFPGECRHSKKGESLLKVFSRESYIAVLEMISMKMVQLATNTIKPGRPAFLP